MPKGPRGEKRPADAVGLAVLVGKIATGEVEDTADESKDHHRRGGKKGGVARMAAMTAEQRSEAAKLAAAARWRKKR